MCPERSNQWLLILFPCLAYCGVRCLSLESDSSTVVSATFSFLICPMGTAFATPESYLAVDSVSSCVPGPLKGLRELEGAHCLRPRSQHFTGASHRIFTPNPPRPVYKTTEVSRDGVHQTRGGPRAVGSLSPFCHWNLPYQMLNRAPHLPAPFPAATP